jgi:hypothetical protein
MHPRQGHEAHRICALGYSSVGASVWCCKHPIEFRRDFQNIAQKMSSLVLGTDLVLICCPSAVPRRWVGYCAEHE